MADRLPEFLSPDCAVLGIKAKGMEWPGSNSQAVRGVNIQKVRSGRIVEHSGGSNSLDVLLELDLVKWAIDPKPASPKNSRASFLSHKAPLGDSGVACGYDHVHRVCGLCSFKAFNGASL